MAMKPFFIHLKDTHEYQTEKRIQISNQARRILPAWHTRRLSHESSARQRAAGLQSGRGR